MATPLFYNDVKPVSKTLLESRRLLPDNTWNFAIKANSVPLTVHEFALAAPDMPVVFSDPGDTGEKPYPVCIMGFRPGENLLIDRTTGRWKGGGYIPAYMRRYPFITASVANSKELIMAVELDEERISKPAATRGNLLYNEKGISTKTLDRCQQFCTNYHEQTELTHEFVKRLIKYDLLEARTADLELRNGEKHTMRGFLMVSEKNLSALPDKAIVEFQRIGFLSAIHFHLQSAHAWQRILGI